MRSLVAAVICLFACPLEGPVAAEPLQIRPAPGLVTVTAGRQQWEISTTSFDVVHAGSVSGQPRLGPGRATVEALGGTVVFGAPSEVKTGADWVELRGWAERDKNLWYIARYQFFADRPFVRLVLTLTDRHDKSPAVEQSDSYWKDRMLARWRLEVGAPGGKPASVTQHNSYSFSAPGGPWIELKNVSGAPYAWAMASAPTDAAHFQLVHGSGDAANQVVWHPMFEGKAELTALVTPFTGGAAYLAAKGATYEIVDAGGKTHVVSGEQSGDAVKLGSFLFGKSSLVRLKATGSGTLLAGALRIAPDHGAPFEIKPGARHDGVLSDGPLTVVVKDFWQHNPITLFRTDKTIGWQAIETPEHYTGGMGLTIETMISMDGAPAAAATALYAPPKRELPPQRNPIDGSLAHGSAGARYDSLLKLFAERYWADLELLDSFGWRNWGDYQIGVSYSDKNGPVEEWANLQYDLPNGLLMAYLRTGDPALWRFAQASVRHLMDLDLVKFYPFMDKLDGLVYRKGEMPRAQSHVSAEPVTDQGFAFRSLLLYYHLTGEEWARDLAKQNIDRLVYYATTRPAFVLHGGRPTAWMLRAALAGAENFGGDATRYQAVADTIVQQLLAYYQTTGHLPGRQPVWQGQMLEGLVLYHQKTHRADVAEVIVGYARKLLTESVRKKADGSYELMYCLQADSDCGPQWTDEANYLYLWLSAIAYAGQISHDPFFSRWADTLFTYGEAKMKERHDIRSWTSTLGFPHLYLELSAKSAR